MIREPYTIRELTEGTFPDFARLAFKQGGCWCMFYQRAKPIGRGLSSEGRNRRNRKDKRTLVRQRRSHAILVYEDNTPVGWCQYGGQDELPRIDARRGYRQAAPPVEATKLWRITCFFVDPKHRGRGVAMLALKAVLESIKKQGGGVVEAYPVVSAKMAGVPEWRWFGTPGMFRREGFRTVVALGTSGVLMRKTISPRGAKKP